MAKVQACLKLLPNNNGANESWVNSNMVQELSLVQGRELGKTPQIGVALHGTVMQLCLWLRQLIFSSPFGSVASLCL